MLTNCWLYHATLTVTTENTEGIQRTKSKQQREASITVKYLAVGADWLSPTQTNKEKIRTGEVSECRPLLFADEGLLVRNDLDLKTAPAR